jgi:hypothetical protein
LYSSVTPATQTLPNPVTTDSGTIGRSMVVPIPSVSAGSDAIADELGR